MTKQEILDEFSDINYVYNNASMYETLSLMLDELLKEQEWQTKRLTPTEPKVSINAYGVKFYYCPHCQRPILKSGIIGRPRHCEDCGQAVKWE